MIIRAFVVEKVSGELQKIEIKKSLWLYCYSTFAVKIRKIKDTHTLVKVETDDDFLFETLKERLKVTDCEVVKIADCEKET